MIFMWKKFQHPIQHWRISNLPALNLHLGLSTAGRSLKKFINNVTSFFENFIFNDYVWKSDLPFFLHVHSLHTILRHNCLLEEAWMLHHWLLAYHWMHLDPHMLLPLLQMLTTFLMKPWMVKRCLKIRHNGLCFSSCTWCSWNQCHFLGSGK